MDPVDEHIEVADALAKRARRFSSGVAYEAGVRDALEVVAPLLRALDDGRFGGVDEWDVVGCTAQLRRVAMQLEIAVVELELLFRRLRLGSDATTSPDLMPLDTAARLVMETALQIDGSIEHIPRAHEILRLQGRRTEENYIAALALALCRSGAIEDAQLSRQLFDAADGDAELLRTAAARLAHQHDLTEAAAARAVTLLEHASRLAGPV